MRAGGSLGACTRRARVTPRPLDMRSDIIYVHMSKVIFGVQGGQPGAAHDDLQAAMLIATAQSAAAAHIGYSWRALKTQPLDVVSAAFGELC